MATDPTVYPKRMLEETFYIGAGGFAFTVKAGLDMTDLGADEIKGVIRRPNGSTVIRTIPLARISDLVTGTVYFDIETTDFAAPGIHSIQIFVRDLDESLARPSHIYSFEVVDNLIKGVAGIFS